MKNWTWQKWVGKLIPLIVGVGGEIWTFAEGTPHWWPIAVGALIAVGQWIVSTFPVKST